MATVFYNPTRLQAFLSARSDFPPEKILKIHRNPDQYTFSERREQQKMAVEIFRSSFVPPRRRTESFGRIKRFFFSISKRLFTFIYFDYAYASAIQILQDHLVPPAAPTKREQEMTTESTIQIWRSELQKEAVRLQREFGFSRDSLWEEIVMNYPVHAPFTDETAWQLCIAYRDKLPEEDGDERAKVEKAIRRFS